MRKYQTRFTAVLILLLAVLLFFACAGRTDAGGGAPSLETADSVLAPQIDNIIYLIGDGMGNQQRRIAALVEGDGNGDHYLYMESMPTSGIAFNHSLSGLVTDSAAAGTALATGFKTHNGMIAVRSATPEEKRAGKDQDGTVPLKTILEVCAEKGKSTGLITTVTIAHATPACFAAHVSSRNMYQKIALHYLENKVDVLLGGGDKDFIPKKDGGNREDTRDLLKEYQENGYAIARNRQEFMNINTDDTKKVLGVFAPGAMAYEIDRDKDKEPSIAEMTKTAIDILSKNEKGFFLMVEGGKIDWANHGYDVSGSVYDTIAFDHAVKIALDFAKKNGRTLVVVVNDHETGGMAITEGVNITRIKNLKASAERIARLFNKDENNIEKVMKEWAGISDLTEHERKLIADEIAGTLSVRDEWGYGGTIVAHILSRRTGVHFSTGGHTGTPVIVAAAGPGHQLFNGFYDQTKIVQKMADLLGIKFPF